MVHTLENETLRIKIDDHGAETVRGFTTKERPAGSLERGIPLTGSAMRLCFSRMWEDIIRISA